MARLPQLEAKRLFANLLLMEKVAMARQGVSVHWLWNDNGAAVYHDRVFTYRLYFEDTETVAFLANLKVDDTGLGSFIRQLTQGL